jgi:hypothetical protein
MVPAILQRKRRGLSKGFQSGGLRGHLHLEPELDFGLLSFCVDGQIEYFA